MRHRTSLAAAAVVICAWFAGSVSAADSIDTTGATIATGAAPTQGTVTIDAAAPEGRAPDVPRLRPLGGIGTFTVDLPKPDATDGGADAFVATSSMTLAPGDYAFSTFDVGPGVVVTLTGSVTIHTRDDVNVLGEILSEGSASITFDCGGDFTLGAGAQIWTSVGEILVDAEGDLTCAAGSSMRVDSGDVTVRTHRTAGANGDITLDGTQIRGVAANVALQAEGSIFATSESGIGATSGDMLVQAFGGDVRFSGGSGIRVTSTPDAIRVEAAGAIQISGSSARTPTTVHANGSVIRMRAFGGELQLTDGAAVQLTGGLIDLGALQAVRVTDTATVRLTDGVIRLTSFDSDVLVLPTALTDAIRGTVADIEIVAARNTVMDGPGRIGLTDGTVRCEAHGGDVTVAGGIETFGRLEVLASGSIVGSLAGGHAGGMVLSAEGGGIDIDVGSGFGIWAGPPGFVAVSAGDLRLRGTLNSTGDVALASCDGSVDAAGAAVSTIAPDGMTSSGVTIESFAGGAGTIDVSGAFLVTGAATETSGDIALTIHDGKTVDPDEGFLLPESIVAKRNAGRPERSTLTVLGILDAGPEAQLGGDATLTVGDRDVPVELVADRRGRLRARGPDHRLQVLPARSGSSRAIFRLKVRSNPNGYLSSTGDGRMTLRLRGAAFDSAGNVTVTAGRYRTGGEPGSVAAPTIFPARCELRPTDGGADAFALVAGFAPQGDAPASAPSVRVTCGDGFVATIPGSAFGVAQDSVFTAIAPVAGVRRVVLDYALGTVTIETSGIELGDIATSETLTTVLGVALADDHRAIRVRLGRGRGRLQY